MFKTYKCPSCGGTVKYDSDSNKFVCDFCDSKFDISIFEKDNISSKQNSELKLFKCSSCGAETISDKTTTSVICPFCNNTIINTYKLSGQFEPKMIIPFEITKEEAFEKYKEHVSRIKFCDTFFLNNASVDCVKELYVPYFMFNIHTEGEGIITENYEKNDRNNVKIHCFKNFFNYKDLLHEGSKTLDDVVMKGIEPFDISKGKDFSPAYLSGYVSDRYDDDLPSLRKKVFKQINEEVTQDCVKVFKTNRNQFHNYSCNYSAKEYPSFCLDEHGMSSIVPYPCSPLPTHIDTINYIKYAFQSYHMTNYNEFKEPYYILCPVYIINMKYNDKIYRFIINGQNGNVVGKVPINKKKNKIEKTKATIIPILSSALSVFLFILFMVFGEKSENFDLMSSIFPIILSCIVVGVCFWVVPHTYIYGKYKGKYDQTLGKETANYPVYHYLDNDVYMDIEGSGFKKYNKPVWDESDEWIHYENLSKNNAKQNNKMYIDYQKAQILGKKNITKDRHF